MNRIKTKDKENTIKVFDRSIDITHNMKTAYVKSKNKTSKATEEYQGGAYEYADETLEEIVEETSLSAQSFAKNNFKKSIQNKRAVASERRVNATKIKDVSATPMSQSNPTQPNVSFQKSMVEKAKDSFVKNKIKVKAVGATTVKEKVIGFIKGGSAAAVNTAKLAIANTKLLIAALVGTGGVAIFFAIIICTIGLVMGSSFGIFMATEDTGTGYTLTSVMKEINEEYLAEIEKIKNDVPHDDLEITDETPNWKDILAIYAVKVTTTHEGTEVVTVDEEKAELIRKVFWDMTEIVYETEPYEDTEIIETTDEQGNVIEQKVTVNKVKLTISTNIIDGAEAVLIYDFDEKKIEQFNEIIDASNDTLWREIEGV